MQALSAIVSLVLVVYVIWEVAQFVPQYRKLKEEIANGDPQARLRVYYRAIVFEWASALLALIALRFDWSKLMPASLHLSGSAWIQHLRSSELAGALMQGAILGLVIGTVVLIVVQLRANRRGSASITKEKPSWLRKLVPDFSALIPVTRQERLIWVAVSLSAGVCEEIVFRGWLLSTLSALGFNGTLLLACGAMMFGLAHAYQKIPGILMTGLAGAFFCVLYIVTGSLLAPILLHAFIDVRFAILPPAANKVQTAYSQ